ncbi:protein mab-21-like 3 isoform X1 [Acipenser ruthenus]|uniref:protein mab-21-like 3 isoform X1 n=1 Tax=Acipenser ruthenus TaxID=7906 RepID=UPI002740C606|nr:protein mab-21-like 3 isoform X1 [Acipenser ruthenus]
MAFQTTVSDLLQTYVDKIVRISQRRVQETVEWVGKDVASVLAEVAKEGYFSSEFIYSGSYIEKLAVYIPEEFDLMVPIECGKGFKTEKTFHSDVKYRLVFPKGNRKDSKWEIQSFFLHAEKVMEVFEEQVISATLNRDIDVYHRRPCAAAVCVTIKHGWERVNVDLVPFVKNPFKEWPIAWPRKDAPWPSQAKILEIKKAGIDLVAKTMWRPSFSAIERIILEDIDADGGHRKDGLKILKRVLQSSWERVEKALCSYHLKTILFWTCEKHPDPSEWATLEDSLNLLVDELIRGLEQCSIPHYFLPGENLFEDTGHLNVLLEEVKQLRKDPVSYLKIETILNNRVGEKLTSLIPDVWSEARFTTEEMQLWVSEDSLVEYFTQNPI